MTLFIYLKKIFQHISYIFQMLMLILCWLILMPFGVERMSKAISFLMRKIGPRLKYRHKIITDNIDICLRNLSAEEKNRVAVESWGNLGSIVAESFFFNTMNRKELTRRLVVEDSAKAFETGARVIIIPHMANFETLARLPEQVNVPAHFLYTRIKNPYMDKIIYSFRKKPMSEPHGNTRLGALKTLTRALQKGEAVALLGDQRADGIMTTFFGHPALSSPLPAKFALQHKCPLFLLKLHRVGVAQYHVDTESIPIEPDDDVVSLTQRMNDAITGWISQHPEQWFWMHNRFRMTPSERKFE